MTRVATLALLIALVAPARAPRRDVPRTFARADTATVDVREPTVVAYLVIPRGAVDSSADLAVLADDWNVAMATLGDSLGAIGVRLALVTEPRLRVRATGRRDVVLALDDEPRAGYVFARPGAAPCHRRGAMDPADVLRTARALAARARAGAARRRITC